MLEIDIAHSASDTILRGAHIDDLRQIADIYNDAIESSTATFACTSRSYEEMCTWFLGHDRLHPIYVLLEAGEIVGWSALSPWATRDGYRNTVELSVYLTQNARGRGYGSRMIDHLILQAGLLGHHCLIICHTVGNISMQHIAESRGFSQVGVLQEVAIKFNTYHSLAICQLLLNTNSHTTNPQEIP